MNKISQPSYFTSLALKIYLKMINNKETLPILAEEANTLCLIAKVAYHCFIQKQNISKVYSGKDISYSSVFLVVAIFESKLRGRLEKSK